MKRLRAAGAVIMVLCASWAFAGHGDAAQLTDASWWWFGNQGPVPAPTPPTIPDGGLYVAGSPDGAKAVAAVRFTLAEDGTPRLS